jgi:hypothetical protein
MTEHQLQKAMVKYLGWVLPDDAIFFAIPNGGARNSVTGANLKAEGVKAGAFDLMIIWRGISIGVEVKTPKGRVSKEQLLFHEQARRSGVFATVVRSVDDLQDYLTARGVQLKLRI